MKKIILIFMFIFGITSICFAAWSTDNKITVAGAEINLSKNVKADYKGANPATTGGTDYQSYSAATYSVAGTKVYGGASGMTKIKYQNCTDDDCGKNAPTDPVNNGDSSDFSTGWSDL